MNALPTAAELAAMRETAESLLDKTCAIQRFTTAPDNQGGQTETWATASTVACRLVPTAGQEMRLGERVAQLGEWLIRLPHDADVTSADRLVIDGRTFLPRWVEDGHSMQTITRIVASEVD